MNFFKMNYKGTILWSPTPQPNVFLFSIKDRVEVGLFFLIHIKENMSWRFDTLCTGNHCHQDWEEWKSQWGNGSKNETESSKVTHVLVTTAWSWLCIYWPVSWELSIQVPSTEKSNRSQMENFSCSHWALYCHTHGSCRKNLLRFLTLVKWKHLIV